MEEKSPYTYKREKQRFSIRKTKAWGACSVFLGISILFLSAGTVARADTTADASTSEQKTTVNTESSANSTSSTVSSPFTDREAEATTSTSNQNKSTATYTENSASETQSSSQNSAASTTSSKSTDADKASSVASTTSSESTDADKASSAASTTSSKSTDADKATSVASTTSSVNTGAASKKTSLYATSTDNSKKIKSSLVSNHLEEKDNLENVVLSSNSVQPATSISDDTYLKNLGIDINDLNTNSVLKLASLFHIFANQASLSADTNGNLAVKILNGSNDFGTRGDSYNLTSGDIYYIQQLTKNLQSNAFRNKTFNHVVLGKDVNVSIENNKVLINGITMDNLTPEDVYQDTTGQTYIDFSDVFQQLISASTSYTSTTQSKGVISNYSDMNNRYIDVSGVAAGTQIIYVNVPFEYLSDP